MKLNIMQMCADIMAEKDKEMEELKQENKILIKALELACENHADFPCPNPPEQIDMSVEYDSDTPYYIQEGGCDTCDHCLKCCVNYYKNKAKERLMEKEKEC